MTDRALTRNAADPQQVKRGKKWARRREEDRAARLRAVMQTELGRAAMWDVLTDVGLYRTVMPDIPSERIYYNAGRHKFALELLGRLIALDDGSYYLAMEREARVRQALEDQQLDAAHPAPAPTEDETHDDSSSSGASSDEP